MAADYVIFSDGGARGNPGPSATGYIIKKDEIEIARGGTYLGESTNNTAEYQAIFEALTHLSTIATNVSVQAFLDSKLVVEQLSGHYKIKQPHLSVLARSIHTLISKHKLQVSFTHVPRAQNYIADSIVNQVLDEQ